VLRLKPFNKEFKAAAGGKLAELLALVVGALAPDSISLMMACQVVAELAVPAVLVMPLAGVAVLSLRAENRLPPLAVALALPMTPLTKFS
jgi:hypothetical protein